MFFSTGQPSCVESCVYTPLQAAVAQQQADAAKVKNAAQREAKRVTAQAKAAAARDAEQVREAAAAEAARAKQQAAESKADAAAAERAKVKAEEEAASIALAQRLQQDEPEPEPEPVVPQTKEGKALRQITSVSSNPQSLSLFLLFFFVFAQQPPNHVEKMKTVC